MDSLETQFSQLLERHSVPSLTTHQQWQDIESAYSSGDRHYHNLVHLNNLINELRPVQSIIGDWNAVMFAVFYHDFVYDTHASDNEEKSASLAVECMKKLGIDNKTIDHCNELILATKGHTVSTDQDVNYFTDADLSILGKDNNLYQTYCGQIRKEYHHVPSLLFNIGRKKVLKHFIQMKRIYKTDFFYSAYEQQARINIEKEIELL